MTGTQRIHTVFAANREDTVKASWSFEYLLHFIRYSLPILPTFLAGVYGYRYVTGVDWFGYPKKADQEESDYATPARIRLPATAELIAGSKLDSDAILLAVKAEQHYIQIWSDKGTDLVRFKFSDLPATLENTNGAQVHRSWWVNFDEVRETEKQGRKLELIINDELRVPVQPVV